MTATLRNAIRAEWTKLRTIPSNCWLLLDCVTVTVATSALTTSIDTCQPGCTTDPTKLSLSGVQLGQAIVVILAVLAVSGDYSSGMIGLTLTAVPRRSTVLAAKLTVIGTATVAAGAVAVLGSVLAGRLLLPANGFTVNNGAAPLSLDNTLMLQAAAGSVAYLALIALLSVGVATATRDAALAMTTTFGLLYILPVIGHVLLNPVWQNRIERYAPANAGLAIQSTRNLGSLPISPWAGLGVLTTWTTVTLVIAWILLARRDA
jgi:ABC-2 type transport system permease protein